MNGNRFEVVTLSAPAFLASYLINHDASGIEPGEKQQADSWLECEGLGFPVDCSEESFFAWSNDASRFFPLGGDCLEYSFLVPRKEAANA